MKPRVQIIISGFITGLSFHPFNIGFFSWFSFIPLFHIFLISNLKQSLFYGYVFGLSFNLTAFYWIGSNSGADILTVIGSLIAATSYLAIFWLIAGFIFSLIPIKRRKGSGSLIFPFLIVVFVCLSTPVKSKTIGEGDLYLDDGTIKYLQQYINGKNGFPAAFLISIDGSYSIYWSCQSGSNNCTGCAGIIVDIACL